MTLRKTLYFTYIGILLLVLMITMYFVEAMIVDQKTANIVILAVLTITLILSCVNYLVMSPMLKVLLVLQRTSQKNAAGEFITIPNKTLIKEIAMLLKDYNQMVNQLEKQVTQIKQVEKEKSEMICNLSHDIKTPVSSLIALGQALSDDILEESEKIYYLQAVLDNCYRISDLSDELFQVVESDKIALESRKDEIWLDTILIKVLNAFKGKIDYSKREISVDGMDMTKPIYSDESSIYRILYNVIDNSLKYSQSGTSIKIKIIEQLNYVEIRIKDYGQGISLREQENIFKRTYRVEKSRNLETGGHGLGLSINKQLLQNIGGSISVFSEIEMGSTFYIKIPYSY
ncbi:sensor histidine kinase [Carnobacterium gallinarum]|uniref:sensor histidine kinase n=1 Tax=Carnobacterium gallinarum TaxID=2749 RepID=UPI000558E921|nr:HAMP domain-containing sensor histidine kinase [Carnobacterium gallinarum]